MSDNKQENQLKVPEGSRIQLEGYGKSNMLISAKYKSSLFENKIMAIALWKIQKGQFSENEGGLTCSIPASEMTELMNKDKGSGSFYDQLKAASENMTSRTLGVSDPEKKTFHYISVVTTAHYEDGILSIEFHRDLKDNLSDLKRNYTILNLSTMMNFRSVYAFRLYEILRSRAYNPKGAEPRNLFDIEFGLSELKLNLGVVNAELDSVQRILKGKGAPDYDKAVEKSPEKQFKRWSDFKTYCIDVGMKEINAKTDMDVSYDTVKYGRGGKVHGVIFHVRYKDVIDNDTIRSLEEEIQSVTQEPPRELTDDEKFDFYYDVKSLIREKIAYSDIQAIAEAASYQFDKIKTAYELSQEAGDIDNLTGWLISAIRRNYQPSVKKQNKTGGFSNFESRNNDYDALQRQMVERTMKNKE